MIRPAHHAVGTTVVRRHHYAIEIIRRHVEDKVAQIIAVLITGCRRQIPTVTIAGRRIHHVRVLQIDINIL